MSKNIIWIIFLAFMGCSHQKKPHPISHKNISTNKSLERNILETINKTDPNINIGFIISSLHSSDVFISKNPDRHFMPASTIKIITIASALHYLGPYFRFKTGIYTDGINHIGEIKNLYIKGSGDPNLNDAHVYALIQELKQLGIKSISGSIFIDDQIFDNIYWSKGAMWDDRNRGFAAPISGLNFCYNRIVVKTTPAIFNDVIASTIIIPSTKYVKVTSKINMAKENSITYNVQSPNNKNEGLSPNDEIIFSGQMKKNSEDAYNLFSVSDPSLFLGTFFKETLNAQGIKFNGLIERKKTPPNSKFLTQHTSASLAESLIDFTKISNNLANDALIKAIAFYKNGQHKPATFDDGLKLVHKFLKEEVKIETSNLITADGSGISRYSLITPNQMMTILNYAANQFLWGAEFVAALPIGGEDGTLGNRFVKNGLRGQIRAKSGSMTSINNLVGFANVDGEKLAFVIMINGFVGPVSKYSTLQENILSSFFESKNNKAFADR